MLPVNATHSERCKCRKGGNEMNQIVISTPEGMFERYQAHVQENHVTHKSMKEHYYHIRK